MPKDAQLEPSSQILPGQGGRLVVLSHGGGKEDKLVVLSQGGSCCLPLGVPSQSFRALLGIYSLQTPSGSPGEGGGRAGVGRSMPPTFLLLTPKAHLMCDLVWREVVATFLVFVCY